MTFAEAEEGVEFLPYSREEETLARPWAIPGTPGLEHRIGGLEHAHLTGNVSYDPENHEQMTLRREAKCAAVANDIPPIQIDGPDSGDLLVLGWGSTYGSIRSAVLRMQAAGASVSHVHLRHLNPFPSDLGDVLSRFDQVLVPELNRGQLSRLIRAEYLVDAASLCKIQGLPFKASEIEAEIATMLKMEL